MGESVSAKYRRLARIYDHLLRPVDRLRHQAVERLALRSGDVVADIACGTGLSLPLLVARVGPTGNVVGVDISAEMLDRARARVSAAGWTNVSLVHAPADRVELPTAASHLFFHFTHDVLQSEAALSHLAGQAAPGTRVVAAGGKLATRSLSVLNPAARLLARRFVVGLEGYDAPWRCPCKPRSRPCRHRATGRPRLPGQWHPERNPYYAWRSTMTDSETGRDCAVLFADLSGFTALTQAHGDEDAAAVAERFATLVTANLPPRSRLVKTIGDEVMVVAADAVTGVHAALAIARAVDAEPLFLRGPCRPPPRSRRRARWRRLRTRRECCSPRRRIRSTGPDPLHGRGRPCDRRSG